MFVLVTAFFLITSFYVFLQKKKKTNAFKKFPEPPANIFYGHSLLITSPKKIVTEMIKLIKTYGKNMSILIGPPVFPIMNIFVSADVKLVEFILNNNTILTKSENYQFLKPWLGNGLILSDGNYWRRHRKLLTPTFHFGILKQFVETFENAGDVLIETLQKQKCKENINLPPLITLCTLDIICESAMGIKINAQKGENSEYVHAVWKICCLAIERCLSPFKILKWTYPLTKDFRIQRKLLKILHGFTLNVIKNKKNNVVIRETTNKLAFLDMLLKFHDDEGIKLLQEEIREEVDTFMFAGHDTTSTSICFTLFCLAEHPEVQEKVFQEQKTLFGNVKNPTVTYTELQDMKYLENVIKEALRLYPPVPVIGRYTKEDIHFDGCKIPKNSNIVLLIYGMHRQADYFSDPDKFDPDRFENIQKFLPYSYVPFSAGPRNCIGQKYAMLEMKSIISKIVRHFEILPAIPKHTLELSVEVVLKSANGVRVGLQTRK